MSNILDTYDPIVAYPDTQFPIKVVDNPTIVTYPSGDTYAVSSSTRLRVPTGTTLESETFSQAQLLVLVLAFAIVGNVSI